MYHQTILFRHKCYFCDLTEGNDLVIYIISEIGVGKYHKLLIDIRGEPQIIKKKLPEIQKKYKNYKIRIVEKEKNKYFVDFYIPQQKKLGGKRPIPKIALDSGCLVSRMIGMPYKGKKGWEYLETYSKTKSNMDKFKKRLKQVGEIRIISNIEKTSFPTTSNYLNFFFQDYSTLKLTKKQEETIKQAIKEGYYFYPRKINIKEIAKINNKNPKTIQEQLRRAEEKIINTYLTITKS